MIELLISLIKDEYIRESFRRVQLNLKELESRVGDSGSSGDTINNIIAASVWRKINKNVAASSTTVLDAVSINDFKTAKYIVSVRNEVTNKTTTLQMTITNENGSLCHSISDRLGKDIDFIIEPVLNAGNMDIELTNNEVDAMSVNMARLVL